MRPVYDVIEALEDPQNTPKLKKFFHWTKEAVDSIHTRSVMKGRTNSPKGKDGLRSGICIFNEIHQYQNYANINVFTTGLGKKEHPRRTYYTTNGDVRGGPLDDLLNTASGILREGNPDHGFLPFICRLDSVDEVHDPANWVKANPSLPYRPSLRAEIEKEYEDWKRAPSTLSAFMTKRMNIPQSDAEVAVTDWENIAATNQPLPDMEGWTCTVGIDYASMRDWASVRFHFRKGDNRYTFGRSWVCTQSPELWRIKAPWRQWDNVIPVDDVEISPYLLTDYIAEAGQDYYVAGIALDNFRYALMADALRSIGFDAKDAKNVYLVRPSDIMKIVPVIDSIFNNHQLAAGDDPSFRWAINNTKLVRSGRKDGTDTGNFYYAKIEGKSRKTDPFMAEVAAIIIEKENLLDFGDIGLDMGVF